MHELVGRVNCKQESNLLFRHICNTVVVPRLMQLRILAKNHYNSLGYQGGTVNFHNHINKSIYSKVLLLVVLLKVSLFCIVLVVLCVLEAHSTDSLITQRRVK